MKAMYQCVFSLMGYQLCTIKVQIHHTFTDGISSVPESSSSGTISTTSPRASDVESKSRITDIISYGTIDVGWSRVSNIRDHSIAKGG